MSANSKGPVSTVSIARSRKSSRMACFQPLVDHHPIGHRVDLGHPGLAAVEQVDGLGHRGQGIAVGRAEGRGPFGEGFDP